MNYEYKVGDVVNSVKLGIVKVLFVDNQDTKLPFLVEILNNPQNQRWIAYEDIISTSISNEVKNEDQIKIGDIVEYVGNNPARQGSYWKVIDFLDKNRAIQVYGLLDRETKIFKTKDFVKSKKTVDQIKQNMSMDDVLLTILTSTFFVENKIKELKKQIDGALDDNDEELFVKLTNQLSQLQR